MAPGFRLSALDLFSLLNSGSPGKSMSYNRTQRPKPDLIFASQNLAKFAVDLDRFLGGLVDHLYPAAGILGHLGLGKQITRLHDGFERVAEVVRQGAKFFRAIDGRLAGC